MLRRINKLKAKGTTSLREKKKNKKKGKHDGTSQNQSTSATHLKGSQLRLRDEPESSIEPSDTVPHDMPQDSDCEVAFVEKTKKRGRTMRTDIWNRTADEKLPEKFNKYGQCVDDGELGSFCGTVARNPDLTPLQYEDWRKVPKDVKEKLWEIVKTKFDLGPKRRKWVLGKIGASLRTFRFDLYQTNFHNYKTRAELKANRDLRTNQDQWEKLCDKWFSPEWQVSYFDGPWDDKD